VSRRDPRDLLSTIVAAEEASAEREPFCSTTAQGGPIIIGPPNWPDDEPAPSSVEVDDLEERGWVRVYPGEGSGRGFASTVRGQDVARAYAREQAAAEASRVRLDWPSVSPLLELFLDSYEAQGAPEYGVECRSVLNRLDDPINSRALVRELVRGGYLDAVNEIDQSDIPVTVRPSLVALRIMGRWPATAPEVALDGLVEALNTAIASTDDESKRSKLTRVRDGLLGVGRDVALAYFEKKAVI
jgi:hypothetical protein